MSETFISEAEQDEIRLMYLDKKLRELEKQYTQSVSKKYRNDRKRTRAGDGLIDAGLVILFGCALWAILAVFCWGGRLYP